jgi:hypothetical protein
VIGVALQTGVTSAVKAVKFSAKLIGNPSAVAAAGAESGAAAGAAAGAEAGAGAGAGAGAD